jgi:acetyl-CoA carboxylase biotin carboxyl carrier protein
VGPAEREGNLYAVRSPVAGSFYRTPSPEDPPYVELGERVGAERVLCFIEATGLARDVVPGLPAHYSGVVDVHYEVVAGVPGEVAGILVEEAGGVEPGQPLFHLRPEE